MFQTGYFDAVSLVISGGASSSTTALSGNGRRTISKRGSSGFRSGMKT